MYGLAISAKISRIADAMEQKTYAIRTFGCAMNHSDSERVATVMESCGFIPTAQESADVMIFNTCSIRKKAEDKVHGALNVYREKYPNAKIGLTGCMVRQTGDRGVSYSKDELLRFDTIDFVFRIEDVGKLPKILSPLFHGKIEEGVNDRMDFCGTEGGYFRIIPKSKNLAQVKVPIMQGCNKFCTYCIVPHTRGRELSRPIEEIYDECKQHVLNGAKEITLLGQNVNSYTHEGRKAFPELLKEIDTLHEYGLSRIRFDAPHPQDFTEEVTDVLASMKTSCAHVHLPVQHGSDRMLRAMNRNYTIDKYENTIAYLRKRIPNVRVTTDIIVGFPGENDDDYWKLCEFARKMQFDFVFTAIFSPRPNTPAARMKKDFIPSDIQKERFQGFDAIVKKYAFANRELFMGKVLEVLVETSEPQDDGRYLHKGHTREFFEVQFWSDEKLVGKEIPVEITERHGFLLEGVVAQ